MIAASTAATLSDYHGPLRQMLAVLEEERQALASFDLERILSSAAGKQRLCDVFAAWGDFDLDEEARGLLDAVRRLNETNRRLRNLIAANVQARLSALTGSGWRYAGARMGGAND